MLRPFAALCVCTLQLLSLKQGAAGAAEADMELLSHIEGGVDDAAAALEAVLGRFAALLHGPHHGGSAAALFEYYNRFKDGKVQTLGPQEVRELLKDLDIGPYALRGEYAATLTRALDADDDSRISEAELSQAVAALSCWVDGSAPEPLARARALASLASQALQRPGLDALLADLSACAPLRSLWRLHLQRAQSAETLLARSAFGAPSAAVCEAELVSRVQSSTRGTGGAGSGAIRRELQATFGVEPLLLRHVAALGLIQAFDASEPPDGRLDEAELRAAAAPLCAAAAPFASGRASVVAAAESFVFGRAGWGVKAFVEALEDKAGAAHGAAAQAARRGVESSAELAALVEAYVQLAPEGALTAEKGKEHDEL